MAVDNDYGVAFHSTVLAGLGVDEAAIDAMGHGDAPKVSFATVVGLIDDFAGQVELDWFPAARRW